MSYSITSGFRRLWKWWAALAIILTVIVLWFLFEPSATEKKQLCDEAIQTLRTTHDAVDLQRARILVQKLNCAVSRLPGAGSWLYDHFSLDNVQKLATLIAVAIGGFWVVMNYNRNRTHVPRLQVEVTSELVKRNGLYYLLVKCTAKNVGLSIIHLSERGTLLVVGREPRLEAKPKTMDEVPCDDVASFAIFTHSYTRIEPALTISEEILISVGMPESDTYQVRLRVSTIRRSFLSTFREKWVAIAVSTRKDEARRREVDPETETIG
jgi:hypothetical protein